MWDRNSLFPGLEGKGLRAFIYYYTLVSRGVMTLDVELTEPHINPVIVYILHSNIVSIFFILYKIWYERNI